MEPFSREEWCVCCLLSLLCRFLKLFTNRKALTLLIVGIFERQKGYRNDETSGVAVADEPESLYAVFGGRHFNEGCCFDYGNAETNNDDTGAGSMEAIYFGA